MKGLLAGVTAALMLTLVTPGCMHQEIKPPSENIHLEVYSSVSPANPGYAEVQATVEILNSLHPWLSASMKVMELPESVHIIDKMTPEEKRYTFPWFMPSEDFHMARGGVAPRYNRKFTDLMYVGKISHMGWAFLTYNPTIRTHDDLIDRTIGVTGEETSTRILSDAILKDAWGIFDRVTLKNYDSAQIRDALLSGDIDVAFCGQVWETIGGKWKVSPGLIDILDAKQTYWLSISMEDVNKVNRNNPWSFNRLGVPRGFLRGMDNPPEDIDIPDFQSAMVAWKDTEDVVVYELLKFLIDNAETWSEMAGGIPMSLGRMADFPGIVQDMVHPGALQYYNENGLRIPTGR